MSTPGSFTHQFLNFLLVTNGLSPEDVSTVSVGMSASSVSALEHGKVDAAVLISSAISAFKERHPSSAFIADTSTVDGVREAFGADTFPSLGLAAQDSWLRGNAETARRLVRALKRGVRWVRDHPAEEVRGMIPEGARMTEAADLQSIRRIQRGLSTDGQMPPGSPELIQKFLAISDAKVRAAHIEAANVYSNEFASAK